MYGYAARTQMMTIALRIVGCFDLHVQFLLLDFCIHVRTRDWGLLTGVQRTMERVHPCVGTGAVVSDCPKIGRYHSRIEMYVLQQNESSLPEKGNQLAWQASKHAVFIILLGSMVLNRLKCNEIAYDRPQILCWMPKSMLRVHNMYCKLTCSCSALMSISSTTPTTVP